MVTLTIQTSTSNNVSLTASGYAQQGNSITVPKGTTVHYVVSDPTSYYNPISGDLVVNENYTHVVSLISSCVLYNTPILLSNGNYKEAQDIELGEFLLTYNEDNKKFEPNEVLSIIKNTKEDIIKVTFEDGDAIELTSGHTLFTEKGWASYDNSRTRKEGLYNGAELYQLEIGDKVLDKNNTYIKIVNIETEELGFVNVYDFTINKAHTFLCGTGKVVHNVISSGG